MPINCYEPAYVPVLAANGHALGTVRGLSLQDIQKLSFTYLQGADELADIFKTLMNATEIADMVPDDMMKKYLFQIVQDAPGLVSAIIELGGDVPEEQVDMVKRMPISVQFALLEGIFKATFEDIGGVKKFWGVVAGIVRSFKPANHESETA